jgi:phosphonate transport system substrate-binding protein
MLGKSVSNNLCGLGLFSIIVLMMGCGSGARTTKRSLLRFTAIPDQNTTELQERFQPLAAYLTRAMGTTVVYVPSHDYQASVEMFKNGDVHLAWFGGLTGVQARSAVPGARAIAQGEVDPKYYSYFIAHKDTGLEYSHTLPANLGKFKFTLGSQSSTSGRLMPEYFIRKHTGKTLTELFENPVGFSGSHDKTIELVQSGQYQVGAVNYKVFDERLAAGKLDSDIVRIIWKTPFYSDYNWTVRPDVDTHFGMGFTNLLQAALISIDDPKLLSALPRKRLIEAKNEEFEPIREVAKELGMLR